MFPEKKVFLHPGEGILVLYIVYPKFVFWQDAVPITKEKEERDFWSTSEIVRQMLLRVLRYTEQNEN